MDQAIPKQCPACEAGRESRFIDGRCMTCGAPKELPEFLRQVPVRDGFPGAPRQLTPSELAEATKKLRAAMAEFESRGGRKCHCGGLIYPAFPDARYTCTHGVVPLTSAEIGAIRDAWAADRASTARRALVQGSRQILKDWPGHEPGTIAWWEHEEAYADYKNRYGGGQSAERLNDRGGFGYIELVEHLKRAPTTWRKREP